ncbi:substrate-binding domain-containing protein [Christensenella hongkongensis]|uniref:Xylose ABC transporter, substrate-binding component n=1 Tax=Christensenella hongkongensis TaxID=270498 RepID=A0A0M2NLS7_9FIRM|nr:substrate-binding domain-containing protein [Christensenella hongkongensis]KKI51936.1 Xylose ABC transporter, substrate-binding component [Christensenella hongkongensis]TCW24533.1 cellooligosaccharide-binding protein [Christensenella hongkongensis]
MKKVLVVVLAVVLVCMSFMGCAQSGSTETAAQTTGNETAAASDNEPDAAQTAGASKLSKASEAEDDYQPKKDFYHIYATYKLIHNWYDAIKTGADAAIAELAEQGITVQFDWEAPVTPDALDQVNRIESAVAKNPDLIAVDISQEDTTTTAINNAVKAGIPVMTFAGSDLPNSERTAFVGNLDNEGDGYALAVALFEAMGGKGKVATLEGTIGAPSHEQRIEGFNRALEEYPEIEVVDRQRDEDLVEKAVQITESYIQKHPDLGGIWCNNASNPVGAAQAVQDAGKSGEILIAGMDHDLRTLSYLDEGVITAAQIQNCYDMGYFLIKNAIKVIDGVEPGDDTYPEIYAVGSQTVYQDEAKEYADLLYGAGALDTQAE